MIARTEKTRLINQSKWNTFKQNGVEWVEIVTRRDARVCSYCLELEANNPYRIDQVLLPPFHPRCRCVIRKAQAPFNT